MSRIAFWEYGKWIWEKTYTGAKMSVKRWRCKTRSGIFLRNR